MTDTLEQVPTIGISFTTELPGKKALVLQSFVPAAAAPAELNAMLDKIRNAAERQFAFGMCEILQLQLKQEVKSFTDHVARMAIAEENAQRHWERQRKSGPVALSPKEQVEKINAETTRDEAKKRIEDIKKDIAKYEAMTRS